MLAVADRARTSGRGFACPIFNCRVASFGAERVIVAGRSGSAAAADGALTGTAMEVDGNARPAAKPAARAIATATTLRSKRCFTIDRLDRREADGDLSIANM